MAASGNLIANTTGNLVLSGPLVSSGGDLTLIAGSGGTSGLANGTDTSGDVVLSGGATLSLPAANTVTIFTGNDDTAALDSATGGAVATATRTLTYDAGLANVTSPVTGTRNFLVRTAPTFARGAR